MASASVVRVARSLRQHWDSPSHENCPLREFFAQEAVLAGRVSCGECVFGSWRGPRFWDGIWDVPRVVLIQVRQ